MNIDIRYINLPERSDRRQAMEETFAEARLSSCFRIERIEACVPSGEERAAFRNPELNELRPAEIGCYLSHLRGLEMGIGRDAHTFMLEDDARFSPRTEEKLFACLGKIKDTDWDILFTDAALTEPLTCVCYLIQDREARREGMDFVFDMYGLWFAGSTAYLVRGASVEKIHGLLMEERARGLPYDLSIRALINQKRVSAYLAFPFLTTLAESAYVSSAQLDNKIAKDAVWNAFRQLCWVGADPATVIKRMSSNVFWTGDLCAQAAGMILGAMLNGKFYG